MDTANVEVLDIKITRYEIDNKHEEISSSLKESFGIDDVERLFPLVPTLLEIEIRGIPIAMANALQRVMMDEMRGKRLDVERTGSGNDPGFKLVDSTDPFMNEHFVISRLQLIPLRVQIPESQANELRFQLHAENNTASDKIIYAGDLEVVSGQIHEILFNPTFPLALIHPGRTLIIENIHITYGYGRQHASYNNAVRGAIKHLDLQRLSDIELKGRSPADEIADDSTPAERLLKSRQAEHISSQSGYIENPMISNPRHHLISVVIPGAPRNPAAVKAVAIDACANIKERLRYIQGILEANSSDVQDSRTQTMFIITSAKGHGESISTKGVLTVHNETNTIGAILFRAIYELTPDIEYVGYVCIPHENRVRLTVVHSVAYEDIGAIILRAVKHSYAVFEAIQLGLKYIN
jgi:DNA-directed RNA polymerase subunit L